VVALACVGLVGWRIIVPAWWASVLHRHEVAVLATVQARSQRMRVGGIVSDSVQRIGGSFTVVTCAFPPHGHGQPIHLSAEVERVTSTMQVGRVMQIVYAATNPRMVWLLGERTTSSLIRQK